GVRIADSQRRQGRQPLRVGYDASWVDAFAGEFLAEKATEMVVPDARDDPRLQSQAGGAHGCVGRTAAEIFCEARHILKAAADLFAVEVDAGPAQSDEVQLSPAAGCARVVRHIVQAIPPWSRTTIPRAPKRQRQFQSKWKNHSKPLRGRGLRPRCGRGLE